MIQRRPFFVRPTSNDDPSARSVSEYADLQENVDDSTRLAELQTTDQSELVDTSEFSMSWLGRLMFSWTNSVLAIGNKKQLNYGDLYKLDDVDMPESVSKKFQRHCKPDRSLLVSLILTFASETAMHTTIMLFARIIEFSGPFFLQRILRGIQNKDLEPSDPNHSSMRSLYLNVCSLGIFGLIEPLLSLQSRRIRRQLCLRVRALLITLVTSKTLKQRGKGYSEPAGSTSSKDKGTSKASAANGKVMNLLSSDTENIMGVIAYLDPIDIFPIKIILGVWYLYQLLGVSALIGVTITFLYGLYSKRFYASLNGVEKSIRESSDKRINITTEMIQGIKTVKLFGWESKFLNQINMHRIKQLEG
ncbi:hypothetical protein J3B02_005391, partial [Coemansia erecta]